jgi:hypothetical protein
VPSYSAGAADCDHVVSSGVRCCTRPVIGAPFSILAPRASRGGLRRNTNRPVAVDKPGARAPGARALCSSQGTRSRHRAGKPSSRPATPHGHMKRVRMPMAGRGRKLRSRRRTPAGVARSWMSRRKRRALAEVACRPGGAGTGTRQLLRRCVDQPHKARPPPIERSPMSRCPPKAKCHASPDGGDHEDRNSVNEERSNSAIEWSRKGDGKPLAPQRIGTEDKRSLRTQWRPGHLPPHMLTEMPLLTVSSASSRCGSPL